MKKVITIHLPIHIDKNKTQIFLPTLIDTKKYRLLI